MRYLRGGLGRAALGLVISAVALVLVFRSVDVAAAWQTLKTAQPQWILLLLAFVVLDVLLRAVRWRVLLRPIAPVPTRTTLASLNVGYLANNVLPARLGELYRSHALGEGEGISRPTVLGTVVVERVVDTVIVVGLAAFAVVVLSVRGVMSSAVLLGAAFVALLVVGLAIGIALHRLPGADRVAAFAGRWPRVGR